MNAIHALLVVFVEITTTDPINTKSSAIWPAVEYILRWMIKVCGLETKKVYEIIKKTVRPAQSI